jgi:hypothetical protein
VQALIHNFVLHHSNSSYHALANLCTSCVFAPHAVLLWKTYITQGGGDAEREEAGSAAASGTSDDAAAADDDDAAESKVSLVLHYNQRCISAWFDMDAAFNALSDHVHSPL